MNKVHYIISDAAKQLCVEPHVLRYWEEELSLKIPRNKMGHRIYSEKELSIFREILQWKKDGLSLKEIKKKCVHMHSNPEPKQVIPYPVKNVQTIPVSRDNDLKMQQFKNILGRIVSEAIHENSKELSSNIASDVSNNVNKELDFLFREREEADEKRFREFDEKIREFQHARQEAAATEISEIKSKNRHLFGKK